MVRGQKGQVRIEHTCCGGHVNLVVGFVTRYDSLPLARQLPPNLRIRVSFGAATDVDFVFVWDDLAEPLPTDLPLERRVLICTEPPAIRRYKPSYLAQFGTVMSVDQDVKHPGLILRHPTIGWWYGIEHGSGGKRQVLASFEELRDEVVEKSALASMVISTKSRTEGQSFRLEFAQHMRSLLGPELLLYGPGGSGWIADKRTAIAPAKFHIAVENEVRDHYWTEKIADAFLGFAFPVYRGAPNITDYFPGDSLFSVPAQLPPREAADLVAEVIRTTDYSSRIPAIRAARDLLLTRFNLFTEMEAIAEGLTLMLGKARPRPSQSPDLMIIRPAKHTVEASQRRSIKRLPHSLLRRLRNTS